MPAMLRLEKGRMEKPFTVKGVTPAAGIILRKFLLFMVKKIAGLRGCGVSRLAVVVQP
jgi:hypothetical protein